MCRNIIIASVIISMKILVSLGQAHVCGIYTLVSFISFFASQSWKNKQNHENADFHSCLEWAAPKHWLKYKTTLKWVLQALFSLKTT